MGSVLSLCAACLAACLPACLSVCLPNMSLSSQYVQTLPVTQRVKFSKDLDDFRVFYNRDPGSSSKVKIGKPRFSLPEFDRTSGSAKRLDMYFKHGLLK